MSTEFEFVGDEEGGVTLESAVFQALGAASMCWDPRPSDQVFDSTRAKDIGDKLVDYIVLLTNMALANTVQEVLDYYGIDEMGDHD